MTRLFVRFYIGVLIVLFIAWFIYGSVLDQRTAADRAQVYTYAHRGGARLVARQLDAAGQDQRAAVLAELQERFEYQLEVLPVKALPRTIQKRILAGDDVGFLPEGSGSVVAALSGNREVVKLGPFPNSDLRDIEIALGGWMRLTAQKLDGVPEDHQVELLRELQGQFDIPVEIVSRQSIPAWPQARFADGDDIVFYQTGEGRWSSATPLAGGTDVVQFGPFLGFQETEQPAATATLALVLLPAAFAIALLLRPVAQQLRRVENAAKAIAAGDLSARVDERKVASAKQLAQSFNHMASRTETLVRTQRELLQAVSHELRTPLSRMRFAIDLIESAQDDAERKQRLESLDAATEELDGLVGELLTYVRMETAGPTTSPEYVDLREAFENVIPKYAGLYPTVTFNLSEPIEEPYVFADRAGFQRVMGNLLSNAGRFARQQVTVRIEANNGMTTIDVDDDGKGIPAADRQRVLEPFVRLEEDKAVENGRGVGLGLALVKRIVTRNGGTIDVISSPSGGCRMRTTWPNAGAPLNDPI